jgi:RNA polymerase sigma-70 factor (sigma-E family)
MRDPGRGEDLVQAALVKTLAAWRRLHPSGDPEAYSRRVMAHDAWKSGRRRWRGEVPTAELPETAADDPYRRVDDRDAVDRLLGRLPAQQRVVLILRYWEDLSEAEIAHQLGCSVGAVKSPRRVPSVRIATNELLQT